MDAKQIKELRKSLDESREKFGARFGVDKITVWRWETGRNTPLPTFKKQLVKLQVRCNAGN